MTTSNYITFILLGVIGLVFLIDFILNSRKKSLEKSVEKFVEKEKTDGELRYEYYRKANQYWMIFSDEYYPGTEMVIKRGRPKFSPIIWN